MTDPERPPCPWCTAAIGIRDVKRCDWQCYCPRCRDCVVEYLKCIDEGLIVGWYWNTHRAHDPVTEGKVA